MAQCPTCGAGLEASVGRCRKCGTLIQTQVAASQPVTYTASDPGASIPNPAAARLQQFAPVFASLGPYYNQEFQQIMQTNEVYKGRWNWAAFFFGPIWAITKGLWVNAILLFVVSVILVFATFGAGSLAIAVLYGLRGNYFYYSKLVNGKELAF